MPRILHFTTGPEDWKALLADPDKNWKIGFSVRALAHCWEAADGFPDEVTRALAASNHRLLGGLTPLLAVPEFTVPLPGGEQATQNDMFVLARSQSGPVCMMVEGKVDEPLGPTMEEWSAEGSEGKKARLNFLLETLGLASTPLGTVRYQLLHRAAAVLLEGQRYRASAAVLLVHSFSTKQMGFADYERFLALFGVNAKFGEAQRLPTPTAVPLFAAWVQGNTEYLEA